MEGKKTDVEKLGKSKRKNVDQKILWAMRTYHKNHAINSDLETRTCGTSKGKEDEVNGWVSLWASLVSRDNRFKRGKQVKGRN